MTAELSPARQLPLALKWPASHKREDWIIAPGNEAGLSVAEGRMDIAAHAAAIYGPEGSGKTHLAAIWAERVGATLLNLNGFAEDRVREVAEQGSVVIEDFDQYLATSSADRRIEKALHHLYNVTAELGRQMLLTGRDAPARWPIQLPDLASRLASVPAFKIGALDDASLHALILKLFEQRGLLVGNGVATYMVRRGTRGYKAIVEAVETLDAQNLQKQKPITVPFVKEILRW